MWLSINISKQNKTKKQKTRLHDFFSESITLSSLVRRALNPTCSNLLTLNLFFPPRWLRPRSRLSPANPRSLHRRVQGILRSLFPVVNVIRSSGIPSFTKNLLARSITSGKSNRTTLTFYPLELFWTVFICFRYFLFWEILNWIWRLPSTWLLISLMFPSPPPSSFLFFVLVPAFSARSRGNACTGSLSERLIFSSISSSSSYSILVFSDLEAMCS